MPFCKLTYLKSLSPNQSLDFSPASQMLTVYAYPTPFYLVSFFVAVSHFLKAHMLRGSSSVSSSSIIVPPAILAPLGLVSSESLHLAATKQMTGSSQASAVTDSIFHSAQCSSSAFSTTKDEDDQLFITDGGWCHPGVKLKSHEDKPTLVSVKAPPFVEDLFSRLSTADLAPAVGTRGSALLPEPLPQIQNVPIPNTLNNISDSRLICSVSGIDVLQSGIPRGEQQPTTPQGDHLSPTSVRTQPKQQVPKANCSVPLAVIQPQIQQIPDFVPHDGSTGEVPSDMGLRSPLSPSTSRHSPIAPLSPTSATMGRLFSSDKPVYIIFIQG